MSPHILTFPNSYTLTMHDFFPSLKGVGAPGGHSQHSRTVLLCESEGQELRPLTDWCSRPPGLHPKERGHAVLGARAGAGTGLVCAPAL